MSRCVRATALRGCAHFCCETVFVAGRRGDRYTMARLACGRLPKLLSDSEILGLDPPLRLDCATVSMCGRRALRTRQQILRHIEFGTAAPFEFMQAPLRHRRLP